jgi:exopolysaccharide production protein ExoQ
MLLALFMGIAALPLLVLAGLSAARRPVSLLALYAALVPFGSSLAIPGIEGSFGTISTLFGLAISVLLVVHLLLGRERARHLPAPLPAWVLLVVLAVVTVGWSIDRERTTEGMVVLVSLVSLYVVASLLDVRPEGVVRIGTASVVAGGLVGLIAVIQLVTGTMNLEPVTDVPRFALAGGGGEDGDPNITAAGLLLPVAIALFRVMERTRSPASRVAHGIAAASAVGAVLLTGSRGGLLALLVIGLTLFFADPRRRPTPRHVLLGLVTVLLLVVLTPANVQDRLQDSSSTGRTDIWRIGLASCEDYCLHGSGWSTFNVVHARGLLESPERTGWVFGYGAHNVWLQVLIEIGVVGLTLFLVALAISYRELARLPASWRGPPMAALSALLASNIFIANLDFKYFWLTLLYVNLSITAAAQPVGAGGSRPTDATPTTSVEA